MTKPNKFLRDVRVLVVEDEALVGEEIRERLSHHGADVLDVVDTGVDAIDAAARLRPDIVLMDIRLKGEMSGIEASERIRRAYDLPVVFLTAHSDWQTVIRAKISDPFGYVLKPFKEADLVTTLQIAWHRHSLARQLAESERRYEATLSSIGEGVIAADTRGRVTFMNARAQALTQWPMDEAEGLTLAEVFGLCDEVLGGAAPALAAAQRGEVVRRAARMCRRDGTEADIDLTVAPIDAPDRERTWLGTVVAFRDVTERERMEAALRESEARYRAVVEDQTEFIVRWRPDGTRTFVNEAYARYFGQSTVDMIGTSFYSLIHSEDEREAVRARVRSLTPDSPISVHVHRAVRADGVWRWQEWIDRAHFDGNGQLFELQSVGRDVHEQVTVERRMRDSERLLRIMVENTPAAVAMLDRDMRYLVWSRRWLTDYRLGDIDLTGRSHYDVFPEIRDDWKAIHQRCLAGATERHDEDPFARNDGTMDLIRWVVQPWYRADDDIGGVILFTEVLTERRRTEASLRQSEQERRALEAQLLQSQKMDAIGRLAAGVAHDFNNLLTVIRGHTELLLLQQQRSLDSDVLQQLSDVKDATIRATHLTNQLLAFSRKGLLKPTVVAPGRLIADLRRMLDALLGEGVSLTLDVARDAWAVRVDPGQIEQVVVNLAVNARDAMPTGGQLEIQVVNVIVDSQGGRTRPGPPPGRWVRLRVRDTGVGMDQATRERAFEPFFTTRAAGRGTGLGLATVYGIVEQLGGAIELHSEVGVGTTVEVHLPATTAPVVESPAVPDVLPAGGERILLVEDNHAVRGVLSAALRGCGYSVVEADSGDDAMRLFRANDASIALLLTDVVMPGMSGVQLAEALRADKPDLRVLFVSGYTDDAVLRHGIEAGKVEFVHKPVSPAELALKVRRILDA